MAFLPEFKDLDSKRKFFQNGDDQSFIINSKEELDSWFNEIGQQIDISGKADATKYIYRGLGEAKYKNISSAQRYWITNAMKDWPKNNYLDFIIELVQIAKQRPLIKKVFDYYNYSNIDREFPILSLLQHYGAPTPLIDWTYNSNIAFYFAVSKIINANGKGINDYFSIYRIDKRNHDNYMKNIADLNKKDIYPEIRSVKKNIHSIFYLSDFERRGESIGKTNPLSVLKIRLRKPVTSTYNQNIIPQEGLFIFNPYSDKTLEDILPNRQIECYNIKKDLSEYLRRKLSVKSNINESFVFPQLRNEANLIIEKTLNGMI